MDWMNQSEAAWKLFKMLLEVYWITHEIDLLEEAIWNATKSLLKCYLMNDWMNSLEDI